MGDIHAGNKRSNTSIPCPVSDRTPSLDTPDTMPERGQLNQLANMTKSFLLFHIRGTEMAWNVQTVEALFHKFCYILWRWKPRPCFSIFFPFLVSSIRTTPSSPVSVAHPTLPFHLLGKPVTALFNKNVEKKIKKKKKNER